MTRFLLIPLFFLASGLMHPSVAAEPSEGQSLRVMTYNLRYASASSPNAWKDRRPLVKELLDSTQPDVIGTQEGLYPQLKELATDLPAYHWIGLGREGGSKSEFMAVFFRTNRLDPIAFDHFWLSDRPSEIGSSTWGNANKRMVTWVLFRDKITSKSFYFFNTHFDHEVQPSREKSAELVLKKVLELKPTHPVILVADFNAGASNPIYKTLVNDQAFQDTWSLAKETTNAHLGTFNGFKGLPEGKERIDWILVRGGFTNVTQSAIHPFAKQGQFPSDHFPVTADLNY